MREKFHNYSSVDFLCYAIHRFWFEEKWVRLEFSQPEAVEHQFVRQFYCTFTLFIYLTRKSLVIQYPRHIQWSHRHWFFILLSKEEIKKKSNTTSTTKCWWVFCNEATRLHFSYEWIFGHKCMQGEIPKEL